MGDGALRYREQISAGLRRIEFAEQWLAHPSAAPLVQLAHARRCGRSGCNPARCSRSTCGEPDAEINWVDAGVGPEVGLVKILPERPSSPERRPRRAHQPHAPPPRARPS